MVIQGAAGSGKTSIALHRIAYLLYHDRKNLKSSSVLVLSPNGVFSDYISHILPELGEENIREMSFDLFAYKCDRHRRSLRDQGCRLLHRRSYHLWKPAGTGIFHSWKPGTDRSCSSYRSRSDHTIKPCSKKNRIKKINNQRKQEVSLCIRS